MPSTSPAAGLRLTDAARGRLDALAESMVSRLRDGLVETAPSTPIVAVALLYTEDDDTPLIEYDYGCTAEPLEAAFAGDHESGLALLWSPPEWDIEDFAREARTDEDEAAVQVGKDLRAAGVPSAKALVLREVAWRLSRTDPDDVPGLPADFVGWAAPAEPDETKPSESCVAAFRKTAPPSALRAYRQRGWLRLAEVDAPRPPLPGGAVLPWTATGPRTEVEGDAQRLIDGAGGGIRYVLRDRRKGRWWAAVAVEVPPAREPEHLLPRTIVLCPRTSREQALASASSLSHDERMDAIWDPETWEGTGAHRGGRVQLDPPGVEDWQRRTFHLLRDAGIEDPHAWFALQACRRINHDNIDNVGPDFVAIPLVGTTTAERLEALKTVAPAKTIASLKNQGLIV